MKELLWVCSSQLILHPITSSKVSVPQLFSRMCRRQVASQPFYPHLCLCLSSCLSHFPPFQSKTFFSHFCLFVKEKKKYMVPAGLSLPSLKPALGHSDHHLPTLWCWVQVSVCHLLSCWQKTKAERGRWLSDSSIVCLLQNPCSQAMVQMLEWVYSPGSHWGLFVPSGANTGKSSNVLFCLFICSVWEKAAGVN